MLLIISIAVLGCSPANNEYVIENDYLRRTIQIENGKLFTAEIINKVADKKIYPKAREEFRLRISDGTHMEGTDTVLTSKDFEFVEDISTVINERIGFLLRNESRAWNWKYFMSWTLKIFIPTNTSKSDQISP